MSDQILTASRLREVVDYCPSSGNFTRKLKSGTRTKVGDRLGWATNGYLRFSIDGKTYRAHRMAWLYVHGEWPSHDIDHINGNKLDNRIANLRDVPRSHNIQNQRRAHRGNRTGLIGAFFNKVTGKFRSRITANGKLVSIGTFNTAEEAHEAYLAAKRRLHEGCTI